MFETYKSLLNDFENERDDRKISDFNAENEIKNQYNGRQIFELLQNIDDQKSEEALIKLDTKNKILIISNKGIAFSKEGLKSLMIAHLSSKKEETIGNKGLGFRSLLNWSKEIYIKSKELSIEFSEANRNKVLGVKRAILSCPEWIDKNNQKEWINQLSLSSEYITHIAIHYKEESEKPIKEQLDMLEKEVLLFLNHIQFLKIDIDENIVILTKPKAKVITKTGIIQSNDSDVKNSNFNIKIVLPEENQNFKNEILYSYLPTNIRVGLNALIHVTLDLDSSRNTINDLPSNRYIIKELANFLIKIAEDFTKEKHADWRAYNLLDIHYENELLKKFGFYEILKDWKKDAKIYPCIDDTYRNKEEYYFYNNNFSKFLEKYPVIIGNFLKPSEYEFTFKINAQQKENNSFFNTLSSYIEDYEDRIELINYINELDNKEDIIDLNKLIIFTNQYNKLKEKLFIAQENFPEISIPKYLDIDFLNPMLKNKVSDKILNKFDSIKNINLEKDLIDKTIELKIDINKKLDFLFQIYNKFKDIDLPKIKWENKEVKLLEIYNKYIYSEIANQIFSKNDIIIKYKEFEKHNYESVKNFCIWLGAKEATPRKALNKIIEENTKEKKIIPSLKKLFFIKKFIENKTEKLNERILVYNVSNETKEVSSLFSYDNLGQWDDEDIIAHADNLGLYNISKNELNLFLKWIGIQDFNPKSLALKVIEKLKRRDLKSEDKIKLFQKLYKLWQNLEVREQFKISDISLFNKDFKDLYIRNTLTKKYFIEEELIFDYSIFNFNETEETNEFFKWLGVKAPEIETILNKISISNLDLKIKLEDIYNIYINNKDFNLNNVNNFNIELKNKKNTFKNYRNLFLDNEKTLYFNEDEIIGINFEFEKDIAFLKWLGIRNPTNKELASKYISLLSDNNKNSITLEERKNIILLLAKVYKELESPNNLDFILINAKEELKQNKNLYLNNENTIKYIPEYTILPSLNLDKDFLDWLNIKSISILNIIEILLKRENVNFENVFILWNEKLQNKEKNKINTDSIILINRKKDKCLSKNLFLKKEETKFYEDSEIIAEYNEFNLEKYEKEKVDQFFIWLGVNSYIKIDCNNEVYKLNEIKKLNLEDLLLLLEKEDSILKNATALFNLKNLFPEFKYWILKDYGIPEINPNVIYENFYKRIEILKTLGIKYDFDLENSLELLKILPEIDQHGKISTKIYKIFLENSSLMYSNLGNYTFKLFTKNKMYVENKKLYYLEDTKVPTVIKDKYEFIDIPIKLNNKVIKNLFGVNMLPPFDYNIYNFKEHPEANIFYNYLDELIPYFLTFGTLNSNEKDKRETASQLKNLKIKVGNFQCFIKNEKIEIEDYEMISYDNTYYIKILDLNRDYKKNNILTKSIENIFLNFFKDVNKFADIFRYGDFEYLDNTLKEKYGNNILEEAKELLKYNEIKNEKHILAKNKVIENNNSIVEFKNDFTDFKKIQEKSYYNIVNKNYHLEETENLSKYSKTKDEIIENNNSIAEFKNDFIDLEKSQESNYYNFVNRNYYLEETENLLKYNKIKNEKYFLTKDEIIKNNNNFTVEFINNFTDFKKVQENNYYNSINKNYHLEKKEKQKNNINNFDEIFSKKFVEITKIKGKEAEEFVKRIFPTYDHVSGYAKNGDDSLGYDFKVNLGNDNINFIEVKNFENSHFYMSFNEVRVALETKKGNYHIYLVDIKKSCIYNCILFLENIIKIS